VLVTSLDWLARSTFDLCTLVDALSKKQVKLVVLDQQLTPRPLEGGSPFMCSPQSPSLKPRSGPSAKPKASLLPFIGGCGSATSRIGLLSKLPTFSKCARMGSSFASLWSASGSVAPASTAISPRAAPRRMPQRRQIEPLKHSTRDSDTRCSGHADIAGVRGLPVYECCVA
jgi:hypothetical protein